MSEHLFEGRGGQSDLCPGCFVRKGQAHDPACPEVTGHRAGPGGSRAHPLDERDTRIPPRGAIAVPGGGRGGYVLPAVPDPDGPADPQWTIAKLQKENARLRARLAALEGEGS